jgi:4'-phosphopantetheinyl transferase
MRPGELFWDSAPHGLRPADGVVHVFCAPLDVSANRLAELSQFLSPEEWLRAGRIHQERDWRRFIVARGTLREILGGMLNTNPSDLVFSLGEFGKPQIAAPACAQSICFNVAHSDDLALFAFAKRDLGVDLERVRAIEEAEQIASRFFSEREGRCLHELPEEQRLQAFFNCWTRKEAYLKAIGRGLDDGLNRIEVSLAPGDPPELLSTRNKLPQWRLHALTPAPEFVGALAVQDSDSQVNCWRWDAPDARTTDLRSAA